MRPPRFIGEVQHRAKLPSRGDAEAAARITLETLGERLAQPDNLAAQLPRETGHHLTVSAEKLDRLTLEEFLDRTREKAGGGRNAAHAVYEARVVIDVMRDAVGDDAIAKALDQLPNEYRQLFESGSEGELTACDRTLGSVSRDDWARGGNRDDKTDEAGR